tara:strand:+ start:4429 stop:4833 length:405 start_codon:yes stop_codon:yes gene_type:complete
MRKIIIYIIMVLLVYLSYMSDLQDSSVKYVEYDQKNTYTDPFSVKIQVDNQPDVQIIKDRQKLFDGVIQKQKIIEMKVKESVTIRTKDFKNVSIYWLDENSQWINVEEIEYPFSLTLTRSGGKILLFVDQGETK